MFELELVFDCLVKAMSNTKSHKHTINTISIRSKQNEKQLFKATQLQSLHVLIYK